MVAIERTLDAETVFSGALLRVERLVVRRAGGQRAVREVVHHPAAVCAVVLTREGRMVFVRQFRKPVEGVVMELPAGKIDPGESPEEAIRRELEEEIGLSGATSTEEIATFYTTPGFCTERMHLFLVRDAELGEPRPDEDETLETVRVDSREGVRMALEGELVDAKTLVGVLLAAHRLNLWPAVI